jgi:hypothetical protein
MKPLKQESACPGVRYGHKEIVLFDLRLVAKFDRVQGIGDDLAIAYGYPASGVLGEVL